MQCKKCGKESVEGATFCGGCGARLDGKVSCNKCGQLNDEDCTYCVFCGTRIDGKRVCSHCGTAYQGNFCPSCGQGERKAPVAKAQAPKQKKAAVEAVEGVEEEYEKPAFGKLCELISGFAWMFGVLISLIFVFLIGVTVTGTDVLEEVSESTTIFYFFGEYYEILEENEIFMNAYTEWFANLIDQQNALYGTFGTVISVLTLVSVITFAVLAIVTYVLGWIKKTENKSSGFALACILSFLTGAVMFYAYTRSLTSDGEYELATAFTGGTVTGIVLVILASVVGVGAQAASKGKALLRKDNLFKLICSGIALVSAGVALGMAKGFVVGVEEEGILFKTGYIAFNQQTDAFFAGIANPQLKYYKRLTASLEAMNTFNILAQVMAIATSIFAAVTIFMNVGGALGKEKTNVVPSILLVAGSVLVLVFSLIAWASYDNAMDYYYQSLSGTTMELTEDGKFGSAICSVIFSLVALGASLLRKAEFGGKYLEVEE